MIRFKSLVALAAAAAVSCMASQSHATHLNGLINYWNFDGNLTDFAPAGDVTDNGTFAGANGTDGIDYGAGLFGQSIEQNGAGGGAAGQENDGYVLIPRSADTLAGDTSTITTSLWVKTAGVDSGWQTMLAHGEGSQYRIARRGGSDPPIASYAGGSGDIPGADDVGPAIGVDNGWHHVVAVSEGGVKTQLWVDGGLVAEGGAPAIDDDGNSNPAAPDLFIGANPQTGANNREWWGNIDDVGQWDRVLTETEIGAIYSAGLAGEPLMVIPEPSSAALMLIGLIGLGLRRRS